MYITFDGKKIEELGYPEGVVQIVPCELLDDLKDLGYENTIELDDFDSIFNMFYNADYKSDM